MSDSLGMNIARFVAIACTVGFFSITCQPLIQVVRTRSTEGSSPSQYYGLFIGAIAALGYGIAINEISLIVCYALGIGFAVVGVTTFLYVTPYAADRKPILLRTAISALVPTVVVTCVLVGLEHNDRFRRVVMGLISCFASFVMFGSPLMEAWAIVKTSDARRLKPVVLTFALLMPASWLVIGIALRDLFMIVSNVSSLVIVLVQIFLRLWIGLPKGVESSTEHRFEDPDSISTNLDDDFKQLLFEQHEQQREVPIVVRGHGGAPTPPLPEAAARSIGAV